MDRKHFYSIMNGEGTLDYELYLNTKALLSCQKDFDKFCNADELQFQVVHQAEEIWMKLINYTMLDIDDYLQQENTNRVLTLYRRVHIALRLDDRTARSAGNDVSKGVSGNSSATRQRQRAGITWISSDSADAAEYLDIVSKKIISISTISPSKKSITPNTSTMMLMWWPKRWRNLTNSSRGFGMIHMQLIQRTIGLGSKSLKGRAVEMLNEGLQHRFFPELWEIRSQMTDAWGAQYGRVRDSLGTH